MECGRLRHAGWRERAGRGYPPPGDTYSQRFATPRGSAVFVSSASVLSPTGGCIIAMICDVARCLGLRHEPRRCYSPTGGSHSATICHPPRSNASRADHDRHYPPPGGSLTQRFATSRNAMFCAAPQSPLFPNRGVYRRHDLRPVAISRLASTQHPPRLTPYRQRPCGNAVPTALV